MKNRIEDVLFRGSKFTDDVITLLTNSEEGLEFFRSRLEDVDPEERADYLRARFLSSFAEKIGEWPWIVMQFIGRVACEEVNWDAVVAALEANSFENN